MNKKYIVVDTCSAHDREDMETHLLDIDGIREFILNHWDDEDFETEAEAQEFYTKVENNDIESLNDNLDGIGYYIENL